MNSTRFSLALTLLVTLAAFAMADYCSLSTCVGMVEKGFNSADCQGEPSYLYQVFSESNENECVVYGSGAYSQMQGFKDGYYFSAFFNGSTCSAESFSSSESYRVGQCNSEGSSSWVLLASVNDTFTAPGTADPTTTPLFNPYVECYSANNCTSDVPVYTTFYDSNTCEPSAAYQSGGHRISANFSYGECFLLESGLKTVKYSCDGANARVDYYQNGACAGLPLSSEVQTTSCTQRREPRRAAIYQRITCPTAPTVAPTPTSSGLSIYETNLAWLALTGMTLLSTLL